MTRTQGKKFEEMLLVKIASKGTSLMLTNRPILAGCNRIQITAVVRQPWTNYVNNGNQYLIAGVVVCS